MSSFYGKVRVFPSVHIFNLFSISGASVDIMLFASSSPLAHASDIDCNLHECQVSYMQHTIQMAHPCYL